MALAFGLLLFPDMTQLDLTGPFEVFARVPDSATHLVWKSREPVRTDRGLTILPSVSYADCPKLDILCVPGGPGQVALMEDAETLAFLRRMAASSRYVTSVCTGSLVLGAAGLLRGYRATCHWLAREQLSLFGAEPVDERIVFDRDRITGAGVTSGIDFALALVAHLLGDGVAKEIQLQIEYAPSPPFDAGTPAAAGAELAERLRERGKTLREKRWEVGRRAAAALGLPSK